MKSGVSDKMRKRKKEVSYISYRIKHRNWTRTMRKK